MTEKEIHKGKSGSFEGTNKEWQQILLDALFGRGDSGVELTAHINKREDMLTVISFLVSGG